MYKFIYVFDAKTADSLVEQGFNLIKSNKEKNIYVFENNPKIDAIEDEDTAGMINMLLQFAGMQSITDLPDLWQNTNEFYLALNFCR